MSEAFFPIGTRLGFENTLSPLTYSYVPEVTAIKPSGITVDLLPATNMDSPTDANGLTFKEYKGGLADGGDVSFTANYLPGNTLQEAFRALYDGQTHHFEIVLPKSLGTWTFQGILQGSAQDLDLTKVGGWDGKIKVTGTLSFA